MLREALQFIFEKSEERQNPHPHVRSLGGRRRVVTLNGIETEEETAPPAIRRTAETLNSVAALTGMFRGALPTAYVDESGIEVVLDDRERDEYVEMVFQPSVQFVALKDLGVGVSQRDLVRALRTRLARCVQYEGILPLVRQIEFGVDTVSRGNRQHQQESLGRQVEKEVRAKAGDLPEELKVQLPLLSVPADLSTEITLVCAVDIDFDAEQIALIPTGDSLMRERRRVVDSIADRLASLMPDDCLVVRGDVTVTPRK